MNDIAWPPSPAKDKATNTDNDSADLTSPVVVDGKKTAKKRRFHFKMPQLNRKQWIMVAAAAVVVVLLLGFGGYALYRHYHHKKVAAVITKPKVVIAPVPTTVASNLTGLQVDPAANQRPVTGVMIENSPDARPQSGLTAAGIVYEAIAEAGITRFLALYQAEQPDYIGPVRSVRPYYLDWLLPFNASIAHVGGSPEALAQVKSLGVRDLDEFANGGSYTRITTRFAPHNVYTSMADLNAIEAKKGYNTSTFTSFPRKPEAPAKTPTVTSIDFNISSYLYSPHYDYDAPTNSYKRSEAGKPHIDEKSGAQIAPKVVVALVMAYSLESDDLHSAYATTGSGPMYVFQDGGLTQGTWHKADRTTQFSFTDSKGATLKLDPGQTWISIVGSTGDVTYK